MFWSYDEDSRIVTQLDDEWTAVHHAEQYDMITFEADLVPPAPPELKLPWVWCQELDARISDHDGWRDGTRDWSEPITREEFDQRLMRCTIDGRGYPSFLRPGAKL